MGYNSFCISLITLSIVVTNIFINKTVDIVTQTLLYWNLHLLLYSIIIVIIDILSPTIIKLYAKKSLRINDELLIDEIVKGKLEDKVLSAINKKYQSLKNVSNESKIKLARKVIKCIELKADSKLTDGDKNDTDKG